MDNFIVFAFKTSKKTMVVVGFVVGVFYLYHWAYNRGVAAGIEFAINYVNQPHDKAPTDGEPGKAPPSI